MGASVYLKILYLHALLFYINFKLIYFIKIRQLCNNQLIDNKKFWYYFLRHITNFILHNLKNR